MSAACEGCGVTVWTTGPDPVMLVDDVSISAAAGAMVGIVGETGAGKTVTMRALLGLLPGGLRAEGTLVVGDREVGLDRVGEVRALLGRETSLVLQNPLGMLDPLVRVRDQLIEGVTRRGVMSRAAAEERASGLLADLGFADVDAVLRLYPHQLSGGMAQRVTTVMGMMPRPKLLVLDEPTSALDAGVRVEALRSFARAAREEGTAVILVSHDLGLISNFCDEVTVMYAGRVVEQGAVGAVVGAPAHPYTGALLDASATLAAPRRRPLPVIAGTAPAPSARPCGCAFSPRCPRATEHCSTEVPRLTQVGASQFACYHPCRQGAAA